MGEIAALVATKTIYVNVGEGTLITCQHVPERRAHEAQEAFLRWVRNPYGSTVQAALDVTNTRQERSVIPHARIVLLRVV